MRLLPTHHASFPGLTHRSSRLTSREFSITCLKKLDAVCACSEGGPGRNWLWQMGGNSTLGTRYPEKMLFTQENLVTPLINYDVPFAGSSGFGGANSSLIPHTTTVSP